MSEPVIHHVMKSDPEAVLAASLCLAYGWPANRVVSHQEFLTGARPELWTTRVWTAMQEILDDPPATD